MIQTIRKTGFLVEDGTKLGTAIAYLRDYSIRCAEPHARALADYLDGIRAENYYEPLPAVEQIEEVA
jgi:hypothetical protein